MGHFHPSNPPEQTKPNLQPAHLAQHKQSAAATQTRKKKKTPTKPKNCLTYSAENTATKSSAARSSSCLLGARFAAGNVATQKAARLTCRHLVTLNRPFKVRGRITNRTRERGAQREKHVRLSPAELPTDTVTETRSASRWNHADTHTQKETTQNEAHSE